jgi:hypothetical protein
MVTLRRARIVLVLAALLAVALASVVGPSAAAAKQPRAACQKLAESHRDLARSPRLVTAVFGDDETGRIAACVLPRGKLRTLAAWDDGLSRDWASVVATAGTWVLVEEGHGDQYGGVSRALTRHDVRTGRALSLGGYGCMVGFGGPPGSTGCVEGTNPGKVRLTSTGAGAVELSDLATATTSLQAFSPSGTFTKLADGAVDTLRAMRTQVVWTQGGVEHRAPLPG